MVFRQKRFYRFIGADYFQCQEIQFLTINYFIKNVTYTRRFCESRGLYVRLVILNDAALLCKLFEAAS